MGRGLDGTASQNGESETREMNGTASLAAAAHRTFSEEESAGLLDPRWHKAQRAQRTPLYLGAGALLLSVMVSCATLAVVAVLVPRQIAGLQPAQQLLQDKAGTSSQMPPLVDLSVQACSGHGIVYSSDMQQGCQCWDCYTGPDCATEIPLDECSLEVDSGNPMIYEDYWVRHPQVTATLLPSEHLSYVTPFAKLRGLISSIANMHAMVGNAVTQGRQILVFTGSSQALLAAMWALSHNVNASASRHTIWAQRPSYNDYRESPTRMMPNDVRSAIDDELPPENLDDVIEIVCSPSNPDGHFQVKQLPGARAIHDHAYRWPMFSPIPSPVEYGPEDIAVFTLSKLTGHAGSRIGWAIVGDPELAARMTTFQGFTGGVSSESQVRAVALLEHVLETQGAVLDYGRTEMQRRWDVLKRIEASQQRFKFQELDEPEMDTWSGQLQPYSPPYLWIQCLDTLRDPDCPAVLQAAGMRGRSGPRFGATQAFVRLELLMRADTFDKMATKLASLALA